MMTHYESLHGESAQRDVSYLLALQRLLTNELGEPPQELRKILKTSKMHENDENEWRRSEDAEHMQSKRLSRQCV